MDEDIERLISATDLLERLPFIVTQFRINRMYSQREAAKEVGCHINTLASFERGERAVSYKLAAAMINWMIAVQSAEKNS